MSLEGFGGLAGGGPKSQKIALSPIKTKITGVVGCREQVEVIFELFGDLPEIKKWLRAL